MSNKDFWITKIIVTANFPPHMFWSEINWILFVPLLTDSSSKWSKSTTFRCCHNIGRCASGSMCRISSKRSRLFRRLKFENIPYMWISITFRNQVHTFQWFIAKGPHWSFFLIHIRTEMIHKIEKREPIHSRFLCVKTIIAHSTSEHVRERDLTQF